MYDMVNVVFLMYSVIYSYSDQVFKAYVAGYRPIFEPILPKHHPRSSSFASFMNSSPFFEKNKKTLK